MILSIVVILLIALIAYLHFIQGLLSGVISAVLSILAACLAMSNYEAVALALSGGKLNDMAHAVSLVSLFVGIYLVLRIIFDKAISGNIRVHSTFEKVGGAVGGVIAGIMGTGIIAIAAQSMPFGPAIAGYSRYELGPDVDVQLAPTEGMALVDRKLYSPLKKDNIAEESSSLLLPVDDIVIALVSKMSSGGALDGGTNFKSLHPDLLQEYFGQRIGYELSAKRTAINNAKSTQISVPQMNILNGAPRKNFEVDGVRKLTDEEKKPLVPPADKEFVTVRVVFALDTVDEKDKLCRISPGAVRLVTREGGEGWKNNFPIGTVDGEKVLWVNRPDDYMFLDLTEGDAAIDFAFLVDKNSLWEDANVKGAKKPAAGTFIEVKRMARIALEDVKVENGPGKPDPGKKGVLAKKKALGGNKPAVVAGGGTRTDPVVTTPMPVTPDPVTPTPAGDAWATAPLQKPVLVANGAMLPVAINIDSADADAVVATTAVTGETKGRKFDSFEIDPTDAGSALPALNKPGYTVQELLAPAGKRIVQVQLTPDPKADSWAWAAALEFNVIDAASQSYKPAGFMAKITAAGGVVKYAGKYSSKAEALVIKKDTNVVSSVNLYFILPADAKAVEIQYQGKAGGVPLEK